MADNSLLYVANTDEAKAKTLMLEAETADLLNIFENYHKDIIELENLGKGLGKVRELIAECVTQCRIAHDEAIKLVKLMNRMVDEVESVSSAELHV